jgi:hypothetical protein
MKLGRPGISLIAIAAGPWMACTQQGAGGATGGTDNGASGSTSAASSSSDLGSPAASGGSSTSNGSSPSGGSSTTAGSSGSGSSATAGSSGGGSSATAGSSGGGSSAAAGSSGGGSSATAGADGSAAGTPSGTGDSSVPGTGVLITPDATGHVDAASNSLGINGNWFTYADTASAISPGTGSFANVGGNMCTQGTLVASASSYGGIGFELNDTGGQQPFNLTKNGVTGFSFMLSGTLPTGGIRFAYGKKGDDNVFFATVDTIGLNTVPASVPPLGQGAWETAETWDPTLVALIEFQIPGSAAAATPFNFCVSSLTALTQ